MNCIADGKIRILSEYMWQHWCEGCNDRHDIEIRTRVWNNDSESPSFVQAFNFVGRCHYNIKCGNIEYYEDCHHELAGRELPLPYFPKGL